MPHCADQEMSLGEQGLPNAIFTSSFVHHPSHFMIALTNPPYNDSDNALRSSAFLQSEAPPQVVSAAKDNFRQDDDARWQSRLAKQTELSGDSPTDCFPKKLGQTAKGNSQAERLSVHQLGDISTSRQRTALAAGN